MAVVSYVLADRLGIGLADDVTIDWLDDAARTLVLARGPMGSADLVTTLASQVVTLAVIVAGPDSDPEAVFTGLISEQVTRAPATG
ncbi:hypothetical protein [Streptomyces sp. NPDC001340]